MENKTMKALVYHGDKQMSLDDVPVPQITERDDVIIKVTLSAICTSDIHIIAGHLDSMVNRPKIMGHEFCGEIVELGPDVKGFKVGDRVMVNASARCGECNNCKKGLPPRFCMHPECGVFGCNGYDGCQSEYMKLPKGSNYMNLIPDDLEYEDVILVPDMIATGWFGVKKVRVAIGDTVVVIGCGPVGLSACLVARLWGAKTIIAVDVMDYPLEAALKAGVADFGINSAKEDLMQRISEITGGKMADCVIETPGLNETFNTAIQVAGFYGRICSLAIFSTPITIPDMNQIVIKNLEIFMGVSESLGKEIMVDYIRAGKANARFMLTHKAPLNDIIKGYDVFGNKKDNCIKWLVTPYER